MNFWLHKKAIILTIMAMAMLYSANLTAQPTNYCNPEIYPGVTYYYCYPTYYPDYQSYFTNVRMFEPNSGREALVRSSGSDGCYIFTNQQGDVMLGSTYYLDLTYYTSYYNYYCMYYPQYAYSYYTVRVFIDWNQDGDFQDQNAGELNEFIYGQWQYMQSCRTYSLRVPVNIGCSVKPGKTRMRIMTAYYYPYSYDANFSNACVNGYLYIYPGYGYYYNYGETEDYILNFTSNITASFPDDQSDEASILYANETYDGTTRLKNGTMTSFPKPSASFSSPQPYGTYMNYKIVGPLPSTQVVYEGLDPITGSPDIQIGGTGNATYTMQRARGNMAYPQGNSDGSFRSSQGGEYRLAMKVFGAGCPGETYKLFTVAWNNDLAARDIVSPKTNLAPKFFKYLRGNTIRVTGLFQNVGLSDVTRFNATAIILNANNDTIYNRTVIYDTANPGQAVLPPKQKIELEFPSFRDNNVGIYKMYLHCDMLNAIDQEDYNDHYPRQGDNPYTFEIQHEIQLQAYQIFLPAAGQVLLGNRPVYPKGEFRNVGVGDASDIPAKFVVKKLFGNNAVVYESNITVQDVPAGKYNTKTESFDPMTLRETGTYQACMIISHTDDFVRVDDTTCITFTVAGGLEGNYTIGSQNLGNPRNIPTIDSAMSLLYLRGLAAPVTFEFTDAVYNITSSSPAVPAWDFTSYIINSGYISSTDSYNTITFKPSATRALQRGGVTINLNTTGGKGVVFGQSISPSNKYSVFNEFASKPTFSRKYANSNGYIIFDGGSQKALRFVVNSSSRGHASAFYLGKGTEHVTIKNVIVENGTPGLAKKVWLPLTMYSPLNGFSFQNDTLTAGGTVNSYSAGVVLRGTLDVSEQAMPYRLDTIPVAYNTIEGNEISGFGYGVMSLGIGQLLIERTGDYQRFYNKNNTIKNNIIHDVARTGIYLGYEENSNIINNRIYKVGNGMDIPVAGIIAGGDGNRDFKGYHNIGLNISGNEISAVTSSIYAAGIRVEQQRNTFPHAIKTQVHFPDVAESLKLSNNIVWGVTPTTAEASRAGIHVLTERVEGSMVDPKILNYFSRNDQVSNNTVIMSADGGLLNTGALAGIALQNVTGAKLYNNAIAVLDNEADASSPAFSAVLYQGVMPKDGGLESDRNAYWIPATSPATVFRFIETDANNNIVELGNRFDYKTLQQWQIWTGVDQHSVFGDFTADLTYTGSEPNRRLRINGTPIGSILNNRGDRINWITEDIAGTIRGAAGQRYDIGAVEFVGGMRVNDIEVTSIVSPAAYQSGIGRFSDAEYVMTMAPVEVKSQLRNNGSIQASGVDAFVKIYIETPSGTFSSTPMVERKVEVNIASAESIEAMFNLADGQNPDFRPQPYSELLSQGYVPAAYFMTMTGNITPRYKIEVTVESDQYNANNMVSKIVRFYIPRSSLSMIVSAENSFVNLASGTPSTDLIAGKLNYDSLMNGFAKIGWFTNIDSNRFDIDIFDRMGWEPKTVNYSMYRTMFWSDGDDKSLGRYERRDIRNFLSNGTTMNKKNLMIGSQEIVRSNETVDQKFVREVLSAMYKAPGNPLGVGGNNDGNSLVGLQVGRGLSEKIEATGFAGDLPPYAGLMSVYTEGDNGLPRASHYYKNHSAAKQDSVAGVATSTMTQNIIVLGVDWRHYGNIVNILRQEIDYIEKNGGMIPVELADFRAVAGDKRVEISWATASELNSDRFEIERSDRTNGIEGSFVKIGEEKAAGKSSEMKHYGPYTDRNVTMNGRYVYRLRMIDKDGSSDLSQEVEVSFGEGIALWMNEVSPNPASGEAKVMYSTTGSDQVELALYDMTGRKIMTLESGRIEAGMRTVSINVSSLVSGTYTLMLRSGSETISRPLTVVN